MKTSKLSLITLAALALAFTPSLALAQPTPITSGHFRTASFHDHTPHAHDHTPVAHH